METNGSGARRRPTREEVRAALLEAAARVFARQGIDGASVDDVAAAAGFTKGAVYSNFGSKDGLVAALLDAKVSTYLVQGLDAVADTERPLAERARALGDRLTAVDQEQEDWTLLFLELWQRAVRSPGGQEAFRRRRRELHAAVTQAVVEHTDGAGIPATLSPDELATLLMALTNGLALERLGDPAAVPDDLLGRVLALVIGRAEPPRP
ncbi:TetR family transcriptional regulator C-terminal domain-containing protein [Nocardioides nanhaiensis]|uniref:TetR family transcriptional regulator n=1 Tax=Nocardioides nanhaiensis TaxID=1476871 RepID=A0ABP8WBZ3_9ACTN